MEQDKQDTQQLFSLVQGLTSGEGVRMGSGGKGARWLIQEASQTGLSEIFFSKTYIRPVGISPSPERKHSRRWYCTKPPKKNNGTQNNVAVKSIPSQDYFKRELINPSQGENASREKGLKGAITRNSETPNKGSTKSISLSPGTWAGGCRRQLLLVFTKTQQIHMFHGKGSGMD